MADVENALGLTAGAIADSVTLIGNANTWRGPVDVNAPAAACVAAALHGAAQFWRLRTGQQRPCTLNRTHAALSFWSEGFVQAHGWTLPQAWDPIAGDYPAADGWVRIHTNYPHHRAAALAALDIHDHPDVDKTMVGQAIAALPAAEVESRVHARAGVAACQRTARQWRNTPTGRALVAESLLTMEAAAVRPSPSHSVARAASAPFEGIRVLDLTRVLAGPVCTGFLSAWGAQVLRVDPPGFNEVLGLVPVTTAGKRTTRMDLKSVAGRDWFYARLREADVIVHGLRRDALQGAGLDPAGWHDINPSLVAVSLNAYGATSEWRNRRGFDSIVQHSIGLTDLGQRAMSADQPVPLPCQALDHATGWLMAAAVGQGLIRHHNTGSGCRAFASLARTGMWLLDQREADDPHRPRPGLVHAAPFMTDVTTFLGPMRRLRWPGQIGEAAPRMEHAPDIGAHPPDWV